MTLINITKTTNAALRLKQSENKCRRLYSRTNQTARQLGNLSGMYQVRRTLERIMDEMENEYRVLEQMERCLETTCKNYDRHETEITEFAEEKKGQKKNEPELRIVGYPERLFQLLR